LNDIVIIALAGFTTGITTVLFGFGGALWCPLSIN
jgi:uncharacterized membrane protein YfcA